MKKTLWWIIAIIVIILIILGITSKKEVKVPQDGENIKIGSILIQSGDGAVWGEAAKNGMELATKKINEQGGVLGKKLILPQITKLHLLGFVLQKSLLL